MSLFNVRNTISERRDAFGVHNPFENPTVPLSSVGLDDIFGGVSRSDSGITVTQDSALAIPTFWRCIGLMSTVIASCPIRTYQNPGKKEVFPELLDPANDTMMYTQFNLWELVVSHLGCWGNAYVLKVRRSGLPGGDPRYLNKGHPLASDIVDLRPINPDRVKVKLKDGNKIFLVQRLDKHGVPDNNQEPFVWTDWEIMHVQGLGVDGLVGLDPVRLAMRTLGTSIAADKLAAKFFNKGTLLTGVINVKAPLASQEQADEIRRRWIQKNGGLDATAEVAVLDAETAFQPLTIPPDSLQFLESRRWQTTEIARMFGIPPHLVGDVEKSTSWGTGIEQQNVGFISYTVSGYTSRIEQTVTREIVKTRKKYASFDLDRLMRGDMAERFTAYGNAIQNGWMNRNEVRAKEDMQPAAGLNDYLMPLNMVTVQMAKQQGAAQLEQMKNPTPPAGQTPTQGNGDSGDDDDSGDDS